MHPAMPRQAGRVTPSGEIDAERFLIERLALLPVDICQMRLRHGLTRGQQRFRYGNIDRVAALDAIDLDALLAALAAGQVLRA